MGRAWQCAALLCLALAAGVAHGECQTTAAAATGAAARSHARFTFA